LAVEDIDAQYGPMGIENSPSSNYDALEDFEIPTRTPLAPSAKKIPKVGRRAKTKRQQRQNRHRKAIEEARREIDTDYQTSINVIKEREALKQAKQLSRQHYESQLREQHLVQKKINMSEAREKQYVAYEKSLQVAKEKHELDKAIKMSKLVFQREQQAQKEQQMKEERERFVKLEQQIRLEELQSKHKEKSMTQLLIEQQDTAFREAEQIDREKMQQKEIEKYKIKKEECAQQEQRRLKTCRLELLKENLPEEPRKEEQCVTTLVLRMPNGNRLTRLFTYSTKLSTVKNFVEVQALNGKEIPENFEMLTDFPRRKLETLDMSLEELGLVPNCLINIQEA